MRQGQRQRVVARAELLQPLGEGARQFLGGKLLRLQARIQLRDGGEEDVVADVGHGAPQALNWKAGSVAMGTSCLASASPLALTPVPGRLQFFVREWREARTGFAPALPPKSAPLPVGVA